MEPFPSPPASAPPLVVIDPPSPASLETARYYARVEQGHRARGLLRTDGGGPDAPYDAERLAEAFRATAFAAEFTDRGAKIVQKEAPSKLHRWATEVRVETIFGAGVTEAQQAEDSATVARFAKRLGNATRHPVRLVDERGNFRVVVVTEDERRIIGPLLTRLVPDIRPREIDLIESLDRDNYCVVLSSDPKDDGEITRAVAVIRAELPPLLRLSCIHEEMAQGLGLANDSTARPSIFNDDDEFARLTGMDEKMLRMLYDIRLKPGMDEETAMPIVNELARSLTAPAL